jgi:hypothetical protein
MSFDLKTLYSLLPSIYRLRDAKWDNGLSRDKPLEDLLEVIADQVAVLEENIAQLYDDQFIETCAPDLVPYIGDLVGARGLHPLTGTTFSQRAQVANTLAYRRRKGTAAVLEQLARDVTDWDARVVEFFMLLATTQYMNHLRPHGHYAPDLRKWVMLDDLNTPFDSVAHTVDVRRIPPGRGKYNIPNVGIFIWRLHSYPLSDSPAFKVDKRRYLFSPLGNDTQLYNLPETEDTITHLAEHVNVPMPLSRNALHADFAAEGELTAYYGAHKSFFVQVNGNGVEKSEIEISDLSDIGGGKWAHMPTDKYAADPVLGRLVLPEDAAPGSSVVVSFHYGFSADMGGGEYPRAATFPDDPPVVEHVPVPNVKVQDALTKVEGAEGGLVEIDDSGRYKEALKVDIPAGKHIELRAADLHRPTLVLNGDFEITGGEDSRITLSGLLICNAGLRVTGKIKELSIKHCTLVPGRMLSRDGKPKHKDAPSLTIESAGTDVLIEKSIVGALRISDDSSVKITDSIVDATSPTAPAYSGLDGKSAGGNLHVERTTIIGKVNTVVMELASNTIFLADLAKGDSWKTPVRATRRQEGCVRFSYLPLDSEVPRRYRCQPVDMVNAIRVRPQFTSRRYGDAGYCQLAGRCAVEIRGGACDDVEMGAFHDLFQLKREINLRVRLDEYLRFGLEAGIFYAS